MKPLLSIAVIVVFGIPAQSIAQIESKAVIENTLERKQQPERENVSTASKPSSLPKATMTSVGYEVDLSALNHGRGRENPPFEFRGGAGTGRVVDRKGNVLLQSSREIGIVGAVVSPDGKRVLVDAANSSGGNCVVLEPSTGHKISLPSRPPGDNLFSLKWYWIGPDLLFGISGVEKIFQKGVYENCCNESNVAQTRFYTFSLVTKQLSDVVMPSVVTQPVVNAAEIMSDGHIHLILEESNEGGNQDLGWFKIDAME